MKAKRSLGENLRLLREERGISQKALGQSLSLSDGAISRYENNTAEPDIRTLCKMAEIFAWISTICSIIMDMFGKLRILYWKIRTWSCLITIISVRSAHQRLIRIIAKELARQDQQWPQRTPFSSLEAANLIHEDKEEWLEPEPPIELTKKPADPGKRKKPILNLVKQEKKSVFGCEIESAESVQFSHGRRQLTHFLFANDFIIQFVRCRGIGVG